MDDLTGTADERRAQLAETADADADWLRRQLEAALLELEALQARADIAKENEADF